MIKPLWFHPLTHTKRIIVMAEKPVAGELFWTITGQLFEIGRQLRQKSGYSYDPIRLIQALQDVIEGRFPELQWELYFAPGQQNGADIFAVKEHLQITGFIVCAYSSKDQLVQGWIRNPSTYPEKLKTEDIFLWGSLETTDFDCAVEYLRWCGDHVVVYRCWLSSREPNIGPALLKPIVKPIV